MRFIDLFAGLGGFHAGLSHIKSMQCVFACEIEPELRTLYKTNHGIEAKGDITAISKKDIPAHDILCAGFPCQPFSLAGKKTGSQCLRDGRLVDHIIQIAAYHKPTLLLLENVPNLLKIEDGEYWTKIKQGFEDIGYQIKERVYSPVDFGIPQNRKRLFIVGFLDPKIAEQFTWPEGNPDITTSLDQILCQTENPRYLESAKRRQLDQWQILLSHIGKDALTSYPIMAPEFGATYPFNFTRLTINQMRQYKGAYGTDLQCYDNWSDMLNAMPSYVRQKRKVASWQVAYADYSRKLYQQDPAFFNHWSKSICKINNSWQILEWRGGPTSTALSDHLIQFRASGIRIIKRHIAPSLTAMTPTQIPIIGSEMRYMTKTEAAHLQSLQNLTMLPESNTKSFKALGNAVNAHIVECIAKGAVELMA